MRSRVIRNAGQYLLGQGSGLPLLRELALDQLGNFEAQRQWVKGLKDHTLDNLGHYLEQFERNVQARGGQVHWASSAETFNRIIADLCEQAGARRVIKGKSMVTEETALNAELLRRGFTPEAPVGAAETALR